MVTVNLEKEVRTYTSKQNAVEDLTTKLIQADRQEQLNIARELVRLFDL